MRVSLNIDSYRASFNNLSRQYNFYVVLKFPGWSNIMTSTGKGILGSGLMAGLYSGASSFIDVTGIDKDTEGLPMLVRTTTLPSSTISDSLTHWMGQDIKMVGKQTFEDWTVTFNIDSEGIILNKFYEWQKIVHDPEFNTYGNHDSYFADQTVYLLNSSGVSICEYKLYGAWPKIIGAVNLDYSSSDVSQVDITFSYQFHTVRKETEGSFDNILKRGLQGVIRNI